MIKEMTRQFKQNERTHIYYLTKQQDLYIQNAVEFVADGLVKGEYVLFVESERLTPIILKELKKQLSVEQLEDFHLINNFTFYWKNGNFHPLTVMEHFQKSTEKFQRDGAIFRTWGHIEWGRDQDLRKEILEYENLSMEIMKQGPGLSVCAYDAASVSEELHVCLEECHDFAMTDKELRKLEKEMEII